MERVLGIGGIFFRASDPSALAEWYRTHLGIDPAPQGPDDVPWMAEGGITVFAPFAADTEYFGAERTFMINFRVRDLDAMIAQLETAGIPVKRTEEIPGVGRFAQLADPDGTPIELWEPEAAPA